MTTITNTISKLTLGQMFFANAMLIVVYMTINSFVCEDGFSGGECVKHLDNRVFIFQVAANVLFAMYCLFKIGKGKWGILFFNILLTIIVYIIAVTLHSISKAGLF